ncbi:sirohydrochlorin chelatase [Anaerobacillus sp. CMMVII]|uniref:sirohydrochlorin chelatase n=1 Tax=Anaerobacillus sp. CMMVII TaxID=2755588 RepID=UPI0021B83423|nr:sirohydrochlorin chelatase [Anaerobacillus sp. CMMVII]MCT8137634.1 sirohydrochlorin chelatase [Anaerobacillus sp. CMMVII]
MKAILYIGHGTRSKKGAEEAIAFYKKVKSQIAVPIQEMSFLELSSPLIEQGFERCVEQGATEITVIPLFLLAAGHINEDIPNVLTALQERFPQVEVQVKAPFGVQETILDAIAELVRDLAGNLAPEDRLLIVGRGSSQPGIHADFLKIAKGVKSRLGLKEVAVCYLAAAEPRFAETLEMLTKKTVGRVFVVPYLLFHGLLSSEVTKKIENRQTEGKQILQTGPLSGHQVFVDLVINNYL